MRTDELDFHLPSELIAQEPTADRAASRLLHYRRSDRAVSHRTFAELIEVLRPGDVLVMNNARVAPARFTLVKPTGGIVEGLLVRQTEPRRWRVLLRNLGPVTPDATLRFIGETSLTARLIAKHPEGEYDVEVSSDEPATVLLERLGRMPLPPYIRRQRIHDPRDAFDRERYQTVYARAEGSIAAPTAGLHFTEELLQRLSRRGVEQVFITLHVGLGTFKPVVAERLEEHEMHREAYSIDALAAERINLAKRERRRVIAVGTTSARVLESQPEDRPIEPHDGDTALFITPGYRWKHVNGLITNFHLPRSTLIALVAGLVGIDEQRRLYATAIEHRYRFFSYGDAMFVE
jgi:S-adenosylmethionine:tRNA ribosyltransferase-isomerase